MTGYDSLKVFHTGILHPDDTSPLVSLLSDFLSGVHSCKIAFDGALGAGKTSVIQDLLTSLGVSDEIVSPSYTLCNEYEAGGKHFEHWDIYRLSEVPEELLETDNSIQLIEWGLKFSEINPHLIVKIILDHEIRRFEVLQR